MLLVLGMRALPPISSITGAGMARAADARPLLEDGGTRLGSHLYAKWSKGPISTRQHGETDFIKNREEDTGRAPPALRPRRHR